MCHRGYKSPVAPPESIERIEKIKKGIKTCCVVGTVQFESNNKSRSKRIGIVSRFGPVNGFGRFDKRGSRCVLVRVKSAFSGVNAIFRRIRSRKRS